MNINYVNYNSQTCNNSKLYDVQELQKNIQSVLSILDARAKNSDNIYVATAYQSAADMLRYALEGKDDCIAQFCG